MKKVIHIAIMIMVIGLTVNCGAENSSTINEENIEITIKRSLSTRSINPVAFVSDSSDSEIGLGKIISSYSFISQKTKSEIGLGKLSFSSIAFADRNDSEIGLGKFHKKDELFLVAIKGFKNSLPAKSTAIIKISNQEICFEANESGEFEFKFYTDINSLNAELLLIDLEYGDSYDSISLNY